MIHLNDFFIHVISWHNINLENIVDQRIGTDVSSSVQWLSCHAAYVYFFGCCSYSNHKYWCRLKIPPELSE